MRIHCKTWRSSNFEKVPQWDLEILILALIEFSPLAGPLTHFLAVVQSLAVIGLCFLTLRKSKMPNNFMSAIIARQKCFQSLLMAQILVMGSSGDAVIDEYPLLCATYQTVHPITCQSRFEIF